MCLSDCCRSNTQSNCWILLSDWLIVNCFHLLSHLHPCPHTLTLTPSLTFSLSHPHPHTLTLTPSHRSVWRPTRRLSMIWSLLTEPWRTWSSLLYSWKVWWGGVWGCVEGGCGEEGWWKEICKCNYAGSCSSNSSILPPSTDYEKVITHYIQLYRYNDALKVLTEKASEALQQHGSEAVGREGRRWKGWYEEIPYNNFITENFPPMTLCIIRSLIIWSLIIW